MIRDYDEIDGLMPVGGYDKTDSARPVPWLRCVESVDRQLENGCDEGTSARVVRVERKCDVRRLCDLASKCHGYQIQYTQSHQGLIEPMDHLPCRMQYATFSHISHHHFPLQDQPTPPESPNPQSPY
jgi:hypothetical protein